MNRRRELAHLDELAAHIESVKQGIRMADFDDPLWATHLLACAESALEIIAALRVDVQPKAPVQKEPEPILLVPRPRKKIIPIHRKEH